MNEPSELCRVLLEVQVESGLALPYARQAELYCRCCLAAAAGTDEQGRAASPNATAEHFIEPRDTSGDPIRRRRVCWRKLGRDESREEFETVASDTEAVQPLAVPCTAELRHPHVALVARRLL